VPHGAGFVLAKVVAAIAVGCRWLGIAYVVLATSWSRYAP
jgi:hypothetical protein